MVRDSHQRRLRTGNKPFYLIISLSWVALFISGMVFPEPGVSVQPLDELLWFGLRITASFFLIAVIASYIGMSGSRARWKVLRERFVAPRVMTSVMVRPSLKAAMAELSPELSSIPVKYLMHWFVTLVIDGDYLMVWSGDSTVRECFRIDRANISSIDLGSVHMFTSYTLCTLITTKNPAVTFEIVACGTFLSGTWMLGKRGQMKVNRRIQDWVQQQPSRLQG